MEQDIVHGQVACVTCFTFAIIGGFIAGVTSFIIMAVQKKIPYEMMGKKIQKAMYLGWAIGFVIGLIFMAR